MLSIVTDSKTIDEITEMPIEDLIDYLQTKGRGRFSDPEDLAKQSGSRQRILSFR